MRVSEHSRSSPCFGKCTLDDLHGWNAKAGATYFRVAPVCCPEVGEPSLVDGGAFFFSDGERAAPPPVSLGGKGRGRTATANPAGSATLVYSNQDRKSLKSRVKCPALWLRGTRWASTGSLKSSPGACWPVRGRGLSGASTLMRPCFIGPETGLPPSSS